MDNRYNFSPISAKVLGKNSLNSRISNEVHLTLTVRRVWLFTNLPFVYRKNQAIFIYASSTHRLIIGFMTPFTNY
jgi:hypothetical protein